MAPLRCWREGEQGSRRERSRGQASPQRAGPAGRLHVPSQTAAQVATLTPTLYGAAPRCARCRSRCRASGGCWQSPARAAPTWAPNRRLPLRSATGCRGHQAHMHKLPFCFFSQARSQHFMPKWRTGQPAAGRGAARAPALWRWTRCRRRRGWRPRTGTRGRRNPPRRWSPAPRLHPASIPGSAHHRGTPLSGSACLNGA